MEHYIKQIKLTKLWGKHDVVWNLNKDINILSGINGSGKSTIINCIASYFNNDKSHFLSNHIQSIDIYTNQDSHFYYTKIDHNSDLNSNESLKKADFYEFISQFLKNEDSREKLYKKIITITTSNWDEELFNNFRKNIEIDIINTFDSHTVFEDEIFDDNVKSELDRELYFLQKKYINYQLDISKKAFTYLTEKKRRTKNHFEKLDLFKTYINKLFLPTKKQLNNEDNQISFKLIDEEKILSIYELSSGEKQLLLILITFLIQDTKNSLVFLDEPEISLHFDWQRQLIQIIRELNPNAQLIISTHSPAMIMDGWMNKVVNIEDLLS
ncbi:AAA family ATPase [Sphingobacterium athyrii]|uniref:ATPase AAA-type core domain-containing protein n=1 Tax=Sphingobacterium athyrii TaxID=2152717 RepID=A0A363NWH9_9SPHI|nr:ATP-binding protein [Sphingobacterium athyrii]PUV25155.1 hypothetical protein DCO56_09455 [Sphingobacterium athyrii]